MTGWGYPKRGFKMRRLRGESQRHQKLPNAGKNAQQQSVAEEREVEEKPGMSL